MTCCHNDNLQTPGFGNVLIRGVVKHLTVTTRTNVSLVVSFRQIKKLIIESSVVLFKVNVGEEKRTKRGTLVCYT